MNHVTSSYAVTGTGMRRTLANNVTQWTHTEMGLEETLRRASPVETFGTRDHLSLNMIMASHSAENRHGGNNSMTAEIVTLTLIDRGAPVRWAPLRSFSEHPTAGWIIRKMEGDAIFEITGERQTLIKLGGALHRKIDRTP